MPSGFQYSGEEFDRVFMTDYQILDNFYGNQLWGWGINGSGELGDGTTSSRTSPVIVAGGGTNWKQVARGQDLWSNGSKIEHTLAIKTDGTLWSWGYTRYGVLGDTVNYSRSSPNTVAGGGTNWKQVDTARGSAAAVKTDGTLWTWGYNYGGALGDGTTTDRSSPVTTAGGGSNWEQVSCGYSTTGAVKTDGTLWTWGYNYGGALGDGTTTDRSSPVTVSGGGTTWKQVAMGYLFGAAIKTDGTLWTWGYNGSGNLGTYNTTDRSSPGQTAAAGTNWKQVSVGAIPGSAYASAIKTDGTLWTWGDNTSGVLGTGNTTSRSSPGQTAAAGTNWKYIDARGYRRMAGIKLDGTLWMWGLNYNLSETVAYAIDSTSTASYTSPIQIISDRLSDKWKSVTSGRGSSIGIVEP